MHLERFTDIALVGQLVNRIVQIGNPPFLLRMFTDMVQIEARLFNDMVQVVALFFYPTQRDI